MKLDQSHLATLATKMTTSSAMNPALTLCLMVCPIAFVAAVSLFHFGLPWPAMAFVLVGVWPLGIAGWQLIHFTLKEPNRLQREQHLERMTEIQTMLAVKEGDNIRELPVSDQLAGNPQIEDQ